MINGYCVFYVFDYLIAVRSGSADRTNRPRGTGIVERNQTRSTFHPVDRRQITSYYWIIINYDNDPVFAIESARRNGTSRSKTILSIRRINNCIINCSTRGYRGRHFQGSPCLESHDRVRRRGSVIVSDVRRATDDKRRQVRATGRGRRR